MDLILSVVLIVQILFPTFREVSCICDWPLENPRIDAEITDDCGYGDANGTPEQGIGKYTQDECYEAAKARGANCATTNRNCPSTCNCFAEFNCDKRNGNGFYACIFYPALKHERERNGVIMRGVFKEMEYDPDLCSKYGDGTDVETYVINDAEDDYDYWQFAASTLGSGKYIWITEEPGFFLNHLNLNEDPSRPCLKMDNGGNLQRTKCNDKAFHICKLACSEREYICNGAPPDTPANSYRHSGDNKKITKDYTDCLLLNKVTK